MTQKPPVRLLISGFRVESTARVAHGHDTHCGHYGQVTPCSARYCQSGVWFDLQRSDAVAIAKVLRKLRRSRHPGYRTPLDVEHAFTECGQPI